MDIADPEVASVHSPLCRMIEADTWAKCGQQSVIASIKAQINRAEMNNQACQLPLFI